MNYDFMIVGAGFSGATLARCLAEHLDKKILVVDKHNHTGGHCYDCYNDDGLLIQLYGPHIFHTRIQRVWEFLNRFTSFNHYEHRVMSVVKGMPVCFPINLDSMEKITGRSFTPESLKIYFAEKRIPTPEIKNSRDVVLSQVGEEIYELFIRHYTKKQWGFFPEELDPEVLRRIPIRFNRDPRYFDDPWQGIPAAGYYKIFERMLDHKNIHVLLGADYRDISDGVSFSKMIYTGPIDAFFQMKHGKLPYRSMHFKFETLNQEFFQPVSVMNYPLDNDYTRITESKHFYFQPHPKTAICYEYPTNEGDPYYPVPRPENRELYARYEAETQKLRHVYFAGRLACYKYINMDQAVNEALELFGRIAHNGG